MTPWQQWFCWLCVGVIGFAGVWFLIWRLWHGLQ